MTITREFGKIEISKQNAKYIFEDIESDTTYYNNKYNVEFKLDTNNLTILGTIENLKNIIKIFDLEIWGFSSYIVKEEKTLNKSNEIKTKTLEEKRVKF